MHEEIELILRATQIFRSSAKFNRSKTNTVAKETTPISSIYLTNVRYYYNKQKIYGSNNASYIKHSNGNDEQKENIPSLEGYFFFVKNIDLFDKHMRTHVLSGVAYIKTHGFSPSFYFTISISRTKI